MYATIALMIAVALCAVFSAQAFKFNPQQATKISNGMQFTNLPEKLVLLTASVGLGLGLGVNPGAAFASDPVVTGSISVKEGLEVADSPNSALYITAKEDLDVLKSGVLNMKPPPLLTKRIAGPVKFPLQYTLDFESDATPEGLSLEDSWMKRTKGGSVKNLLIAVRLDMDGVAATRDPNDLVGKGVAEGFVDSSAKPGDRMKYTSIDVQLGDRGIVTSKYHASAGERSTGFGPNPLQVQLFNLLRLMKGIPAESFMKDSEGLNAMPQLLVKLVSKFSLFKFDMQLIYASIAIAVMAEIAFAINATRTFQLMLPCRDGKKLHTRVVLPRDDDGSKFTTIMDRSPYGYLGLEWIADIFLPAGFATVGQDFRGTQNSQGLFSIWHKDANDSEDLGNWIADQSWSNGEIYTFGASADGLGAFTTVYNEPSWLKAQYFIWTSSIGYDVFYPQGTMVQELIDSWIHGTVDGEWAEVCYEDIKRNEMKTDWWDAVEMTGYYDRVHFPSAFWAGWYDIFLVGNLAAFRGYNEESDPKVRYTSKIMIDPLGHCQGAASFFRPDLIAGRSLLAVMQAYEVYGVRPVARTNVQNITFYVMSSNDTAGVETANYWTSVETFPVPKMTPFYLHPDGTASQEKVSNDEETEGTSSTTYTYDPQNPVPTVGGSNLDMPCGPLDQSEIDQRADVLNFQTTPFEEAMYMTGPLFAHLYVGSDAIDTDFMVRLSDVYPTGEVRLIQDSAVRMRWRQGTRLPVYMKADEVYRVTASLWNTSYAIAPGHSVRVSVTSSNYPRFSANPNNGELLIQNSTDSEWIVAQNTLYHSSRYPSHVELPLVSRAQLPELHDIKGELAKAYPQLDADKFLADHPDLFTEIVDRKKQAKASGRF